MTDLRIAKGFAAPIDFATQTAAVLGRRGSGKTHTASVFAEELLGAGIQAVVIDPLDVWAGLRSSADGKREGLPIVVFGGDSADLPLEEGSGATLADAIVEHGISAILSLRHLSKSAARRFVADFAERLYHRKGSPDRRDPLHLFVDEADAFVPQRIMPGGERTHGAIDTLVRRGRSSGIGTTLISQRAAVVSKDVLTQTEVLVCHQTTGPQDRKALDAWIEANDPDDNRAAFLGSLASLDVGEAWFWSPAWLRVFRRVRVRRRRTFDSSATPKVGQRKIKPTKLAPVDLETLRGRLTETIEKAKADDPQALRKRIAELEKQLKHQPAKVQPVEVPVLTVGDKATVQGLAEEVETLGRRVEELVERLESFSHDRQQTRSTESAASKQRAKPKPRRLTQAEAVATGLSKAARQILTALAQHGELSLKQAAIIAGYSCKSGGVRNAAGELRSAGYVEGSNARLAATASGIAALGPVEPLPTGAELAEHWYRQLGKAEREILRVVIDAHPRAVSLAEAAEACGYAPSSGGVRNAAGKLRTLELIEGSNAAMIANGRLVG